MKNTKPTKRVKRVKAWAVICTSDKKDRGRLAGQETFTIVEDEQEAGGWAEYFYEECQTRKTNKYKVVPCTISYEVPRVSRPQNPINK